VFAIIECCHLWGLNIQPVCWWSARNGTVPSELAGAWSYDGIIMSIPWKLLFQYPASLAVLSVLIWKDQCQ